MLNFVDTRNLFADKMGKVLARALDSVSGFVCYVMWETYPDLGITV